MMLSNYMCSASIGLEAEIKKNLVGLGYEI